jgi:hypothetical protein
MVDYVEAFRKIGFSLKNPRNSLSAESPNGVVLAIPRAELAPDMSFRYQRRT